MQLNENRVFEVLLAMILVVVLVMLIFIFTSPTITGESPKTTMTNSQNTNSFNNYYLSQTFPVKTIPVYTTQKSARYVKVYDSTERNLADYRSAGKRQTVEGIFGNEIDKYAVYVKNYEHRGNYFTVKFYFEDYYGETRTESMTQYIPAREERGFYYKDIYADEFLNYRWDYEVIPQKISGKFSRFDSRIKS